jgi:hypothetical protein
MPANRHFIFTQSRLTILKLAHIYQYEYYYRTHSGGHRVGYSPLQCYANQSQTSS